MKGTLQKENRTTAPEQQTQPRSYIVPECNIYETQDGYLLEAEMPGVGKDGLEITLENNEITIIGRRGHEHIQGELLIRESEVADFRRVFVLDPAIDTARISARMDQGVLKMTLPKAEKVKPRKITVD